MTVSGIRGIVGESLTPDLLAEVAYVQARATGARTVAVGRDTRPSGAELARAVFRGIRAAGAQPIDLGIAPTPTTCVAVEHLAAEAGVIITASHNPTPYNGYKMVHGSGRLCNDGECRVVYDGLSALTDNDRALIAAADDTPEREFDAGPVHVERILSAVDTDTIRAAGLHVGIDATNGAAAAVFPLLLEKLQVTWSGVHVALDGNFVHNPEPRPEHLTDLAELLRDSDGIAGGFAFDPDGDRLAPMAEDGSGISEEFTLAMSLDALLTRTKSTVATNLSTSMVIDDVAAAHGVSVIRSRIGEANVVAAMQEHGCRFGGEGNGGLIYPAVSTVRDGLTALAVLIEAMAAAECTLSALAAKWTEYPLVKEKVQIGGREPAEVLARLAEEFADERTDTQDGLKIIRDDGWVHVRPSNTEPILRCYAEARSPQMARSLADMVLSRI